MLDEKPEACRVHRLGGGRVIGHADDGEEGSEDLLLRQRVPLVDAIDDRWLREPAMGQGTAGNVLAAGDDATIAVCDARGSGPVSAVPPR